MRARHFFLGVVCVAFLGIAPGGYAVPNVQLFTDFDALPAGGEVRGNAYLNGGLLRIVDAVAGQTGTFVWQPDRPLLALRMKADVLIGGGTGADGMAFCYFDVPGGAFGEWISGNGLVVRIKTWSGAPPSIEIDYNGANLADVGVDPLALRLNQFVPLEVYVDYNGNCIVKYNYTTYFQGVLPGWNPQPTWGIALSARSGGLTDNHHVDRLSVSDSIPYLVSLTRTDPTPVLAGTASVGYRALFSEWMRNLDGADFLLNTVSGTPSASIGATVNNLYTVAENFTGSIGTGTLQGSAAIVGDRLQLTPAVNWQTGSWSFLPPTPLTGFRATYSLFIGDGNAADGASFVYGPGASGLFGQNGPGDQTGLIVTFDTYNNEEVPTPPAITVRYNGVNLLSVPKALRTTASVIISVSHEGMCTVAHDSITHNDIILPGWSPQANWYMGVGAATGGLNDVHAVDNFLLQSNMYRVQLNSPAGQGVVRLDMNNASTIDMTGANVSPASQNGNETYTFDLVAPTVSTVTVQSGLTVDVTFSEAMGTGVTTAANYAVSGSGRGTLATNPNSVALVSGNTYRLTWLAPNEMLNGGNITITVSNVRDVLGNLIGTPNSGTHTGGAIGVAPAPGSTLVTFDTEYGPLATTSRTGYTFAGWFTAPTGGTEVTAATVLRTAADHTLYAEWAVITFAVDYAADPVPGGTVSGPLIINHAGTPGDAITVTAVANPGWTRTQVSATNGNVTPVSGDEFTLSGVTADTTVNASFADTAPPTPVCQNITVNLSAPTVAALAIDGGSTDNVGIVSRLIDGAADKTFTCADMPSAVVTLTVEDAAGNSAECTATVTVVDDIGPQAVCQNVTVNLSAPTVAASALDGGSSDNCAVTSMLIDGAPSRTFTCADLGTTTVTLRVADGAGNIDACQASVTVVDDVAPVAACKDISVNLSSPTIAASAVDNGSTDNCAITSRLINGAANRTFTCANLGANVVTLRVMDGAGNFNTCAATVTVVDDVAPVAVCRNVTVYLSSPTLAPASLNNGSSDNCAIASMLVNGAPGVTFGPGDVGVQTVTLRVSDAAGLFDECTSQVTVINDLPAEGEGEPPVEGEGEPVVEGEGEPPVEGEGEPPVEGEGEPVVEGEGEPPVEGEGEPLVEGEGEPPAGLEVTVGDAYLVGAEGDSVTFAVYVDGALGVLTYQWYRITPDKALAAIPDATEAVYTLDSVTVGDAGDYQCEVHDDVLDETAWSPVFTLVVTTGIPAVGLVGIALLAGLATVAGASLVRRRR